MNHKLLLCLLALLLSVLSSRLPADSVPQRTYTFALFMPRFAGDTFWDLLGAFMQAACADLGVELRIFYGHDNARRYQQLVKQSLSGAGRVDAVFFQNFKETAPGLLQAASRARVPALLIDTGLNEKDRQRYGRPREHLSSWLGEFTPDNGEAGLDLALELLRQARERGLHDRHGKIPLLALAGETDLGSASYPRVRGLQLALRNQKDVILTDIQPAFWNDQQAAETLLSRQARYPVSPLIVWAANDPMALGAVAAARQLKLRPGHELLAGGIDWTAEALAAIARGELAASVGGHFMLGGWAAILVYDFLQGIDFAEESTEMRLRMDLLTQRNIGAYRRYFGAGDWSRIDFRRFSKSYTPGLKKYDFGLQAIMRQLPPTAPRH
jgi:ABC-type sugar transport system substrate-binding protein